MDRQSAGLRGRTSAEDQEAGEKVTTPTRAEDSLRFNPRARIARDAIDTIRGQADVLERSAIQTRTLARRVNDAIIAGQRD
ncbi:MAG: hypothetical protein NVSMB2_27840 [Chloroflexota bacterium]